VNPKLRSYLAAPPRVRELFDRNLREAIDRDQALDRSIDLTDDLIAVAVAHERRQVAAVLGLDPPASKIPVRWSPSWEKRAKVVRTLGPDAQTYDRATDPLRDLDLREVWPLLTGEEANRAGRVRCPHPDHEDRWPDCHLYPTRWRCYGCNRRGDIIDLGGLLYGLEPRGSDFFRIRRQLLDALGMEMAA